MPATRVILAVVVCLTSSQATVFAAESSLEVKNLNVSFLPDNKVRVQGELRCNNIKPDGMQSPDSNIEVNIDFPRSQQFGLLPEYFIGHYITHERRAESDPYYGYEGESYRIETKKSMFYDSTYLPHSPVIDKALDNYRDDKKWIPFDKTLEFQNLTDANKPQYRIVIGWKQSHLRGRSGTINKYFAHFYYWAVYGPFAWGEAPPCDKTLTAKFRQSVSFTEKGVVLRKPMKPSSASAAGTKRRNERTTGEAKRGQLVRRSTRPSQLEAVNASNRLEQKLSGLPGVQTAGVHVTPRSASIVVSTEEGVKADGLTQLVTSASVEAAYALPWIGSMEITVRDSGGNRTVTVSFDAVAKFVAGKITIAEFYKMWSVQGTGLVAPSRK